MYCPPQAVFLFVVCLSMALLTVGRNITPEPTVFGTQIQQKEQAAIDLLLRYVDWLKGSTLCRCVKCVASWIQRGRGSERMQQGPETYNVKPTS